uniref:Sodium/hydrogen exchanger n=1 Tax=Rhizophora mucronata TaxID=61149 RepID=A0A2P2M8L0_RHIMU
MLPPHYKRKPCNHCSPQNSEISY